MCFNPPAMVRDNRIVKRIRIEICKNHLVFKYFMHTQPFMQNSIINVQYCRLKLDNSKETFAYSVSAAIYQSPSYYTDLFTDIEICKNHQIYLNILCTHRSSWKKCHQCWILQLELCIPKTDISIQQSDSCLSETKLS